MKKAKISEPAVRIRCAAALVLCLAMASGCVAPGSATGRVGLAAIFETPPDRMPRTLRVSLPAEYGLGDLDEVFGEPRDYGHETKTVLATRNGNAFTAAFSVVYHIGFWLLPPLGAVPEHPPPPSFFVLLPDAPDEVYAIGVVGNRIEYKVYDRGRRAEKAPQAGSWTVEGQGYGPAGTGDGDIWYLRVRFVRNAA